MARARAGSYRRPVKGIAAQAQAVSGFDVAAGNGSSLVDLQIANCHFG